MYTSQKLQYSKQNMIWLYMLQSIGIQCNTNNNTRLLLKTCQHDILWTSSKIAKGYCEEVKKTTTSNSEKAKASCKEVHKKTASSSTSNSIWYVLMLPIHLSSCHKKRKSENITLWPYEPISIEGNDTLLDILPNNQCKLSLMFFFLFVHDISKGQIIQPAMHN